MIEIRPQQLIRANWNAGMGKALDKAVASAK